MRTRRVNRYYCDFCKKAGCSKYHLARHEAACTMNPKRICRVCKMLADGETAGEDHRPDTAALVRLLPTPEQFRVVDEHCPSFSNFSGELTTATNAALPKLRETCGNCPACIMAALRQAGIPVPMAAEYNWTDEMESIWADINDAALEAEYAGGVV